MPPNRLAHANSPYLLQHAENPVDWYEWGPEALEHARAEDRPLFISIGYAACHWCHVMAHESFEDPEIAELLNRSFVAIKIDREERPDLDQLYMSATQAATGHGGWPMSVFATPEGRPFFAGTYFPPTDRGGQPGFSRVLRSLDEAWRTRRDEVEAQATQLTGAVESEARFADSLAAEMPTGDLAFEPVLDSLVAALAARFDPDAGGFGGAPKFPRPSYVEACLVHHARTGDPLSLSMATTTLDAMAAGGIYDHLAGGFARYSVDAEWLVPHFEKMLTDQALLARVFLHAYQLTGTEDYRQVVTETLDWVLEHLGLDEGGLASSVDADAAGREGSHAVFTPDEVVAALDGVPGVLTVTEACALYAISPEGSFEGGASVLARRRGHPLGRTEAEERTRAALLAARDARPQPGIDDKVLVEWNAMAACALAECGVVLGTERWTAAAAAIVRLLDGTFRDPAGRLLRAGRAGSVAHLALLGDHAWLLEAMTRLYELDGEPHWLDRAQHVATEMIDLFYDGEPPTAAEPARGGGFFSTGRDADVVLVRAKDVLDSALPSSSAVAATAIIRLARLVDDADLLAVAEQSVSLLGAALESHPLAVPDLVASLGWLRAGLELAVPGSAGPLLIAARSTYAPFLVTALGPDATSPLLEHRQVGLAYLCRHRVCDHPTADPDTLVAQLVAAVQV